MLFHLQRRMGIQAQRTQYNEFVENGFKSWALMGQRLVWKLGMIKQELRTELDGPSPGGKDSSSENMNSHLVFLPRPISHSF